MAASFLQLDIRNLLFLILFQTSIFQAASVYVNDVSAGTTCGSPPETYFKRWQADYLTYERIPFLCNASDSRYEHRPDFMFDRNSTTFWQSTAGKDKAIVIIDLQSPTQQHLYVQNLSIEFGSYQRPGQIKFSRSTDGGLNYLTWQYYVSQPYECRTVFQTTYIQQPFQVDTIMCTMFPNINPLKGNETVFLDLMGGRGNSVALQDWLNATHIKLEFSGLYKIFDIFSHRWHHYNIREIKISASCFCNGHASNCVDVDNQGSYQCSCQNNACGSHCEECCPLFNQQEWKKGTGNPFKVDDDFMCEACNCHNHSSSCIYNQTIADLHLSLNSYGNYSGGGICQNCLHNTTGINCEQCQKYFYKHNNSLLTDHGVCHPCDCYTDGVILTALGAPNMDCLRVVNTSYPNRLSGDCYCKKNVKGRKCDSCQHGFFNLSYTNPSGCEPCNCLVAGVKENNLACSSLEGQCSCKNHVNGLKCDSCKDGYFNISSNQTEQPSGHLDGCSDCLCNLGGSQSFICNKTIGQCLCHTSTIIGLKCDEIMNGFYYPSLHFIYDENLISSDVVVKLWKSQIIIPDIYHSRNIFRFVFRCASVINVIGVIAINNGSTFYNSQIEIKPLCEQCMSMSDDEFHLYPGIWNVDIIFPSITTDGLINCEKIVALPKEFYDLTSIRNKDEVRNGCDILNNNMTNSICKTAVYTMTMDYLHEPFSCNCSNIGSISNTCEKYLGQCQCKPGVMGRTCDQCKPGFYNYSSNGCLLCDCAGRHQICNEQSGQCICPAYTTGRRCDQCISLYWNRTINGCTHCNCSDTGAVNKQCDVITGHCQCKPGVMGQKCQICKDGLTQISSSGCIPCNCSEIGSISHICNKITKQCPCKTLVIGQRCDQCSNTSFSLRQDNKDGCLPCICSDRTRNCTMASGVYTNQHLKLLSWTLSNFNHLQNITIYNETRSYPNLPIEMLTASFFKQMKPFYWLSMNNIFGDSSTLVYGGVLSFLLEVEVLRVVDNNLLIHPQKLIVQGLSFTIEQIFDSVPFNQIVQRRILLTQQNWKHSSNQRNVTRKEFIAVLSRPVKIFISASPLYNSSFGYTVRLSQVSFTKLDQNIASVSTNNSLVEDCKCPLGYKGFSCESCIQGYFHTNNKSYGGSCVPCDCNNHSMICEKYTGTCYNCLHNTSGKHCENCQAGFYGNATYGTPNDCIKCPCASPSTLTDECLIINNTLTCLNCSTGYEGNLCEKCSIGYYRSGDFCLQCKCNNNSKNCNPFTGVCIDCLYNTSGDFCEICKQGWFGNATRQQCQACHCNMQGSKSHGCNEQGKCECLNNVIGEKCTTCKVNTFGMNNRTGCISCDCNTYGSRSLQCNETGHCLCFGNSTGPNCDQCIDGLWGLPTKTCDVCNCNLTGSIDLTCTSNKGQCHCKPGIGSRRCNTCLKQHVNFTTNGCDSCPNCTKLLQSKIDFHNDVISQLRNKLDDLIELQKVDDEIKNTSQLIQSTQNEQMEYEHRLKYLMNRTSVFSSPKINDSIQKQFREITEISQNLSISLNISTSETTRLQMIQSQTNTSFLDILSSNETVHKINTMLQEYVYLIENNLQSTYSTAIHTQNILQEIRNHYSSFSLALNNTSELTANLTVAFQDIVSMVNDVNQSSDTYNEIATQQNRLQQRLTELILLKVMIEQNGTRLIDNLRDIQNTTEENVNKLNGIHLLVNNSVENNEYIKEEITSIKNILQVINSSTCCQQGSIHDLVVSLNSSRIQHQSNRIPINVMTLVERKMESLNETAYNISRTFRPASLHSSKAQQILERYSEMQKLLNESIFVTNVANISIQNASVFVDNNINITDIAFIEHQQANLLHQKILQDTLLISGIVVNYQIEDRWCQSSDLFHNISILNHSIHTTNSTWSSIYTLYQQLQPRVDQNNNTNLNILSNISTVQVILRNITENLNRMNSTNSTHQNTTDGLFQRIQVIDNTTQNVSKLLNNTQTKVNTIKSVINNGTIILQQINQGVLTTQEFNATKLSINERLANLRKKLALIRKTASEVETPFRYSDGDVGIEKVEHNVSPSQMFSSISIEFKTSQTNVHLLTINKNKPLFVDFSIVNSLLVVDYGTLHGNDTVKNWQQNVSTNIWKHVTFSRMNTSARLTVTSLDSSREETVSQTYGSFTQNITSFISNHQSSSVFIDSQHTALLPSFIGCLGNLRVNDHRVSLLPTNFSSVSLCNGMKNPIGQNLVPGASFYGNGFIRQNVGNFSIIDDFGVEFLFRTYEANGTILAIQNSYEEKGTSQDVDVKIQHNLLLLRISNGRLFLTLSPNTTLSTILRSEQSRYAGGDWFKVHISYIVEKTITMTIYGNTGVLLERLVVDWSYRMSEDGVFVYFGGLNDTIYKRKKELHKTLTSKISFSGCLSSLNMSNHGVSKQRSFYSDHRYGVSLNGCYEQIERGVHFFTGGYSTLNINIQSITNIMFVFKTNLQSGVFISYRKQTLYLYMALFHGNLYADVNGTILYTTTQTLNDGAYHIIELNFTGESIILNIDRGRVITSKHRDENSPIMINGDVRLGESDVVFDFDVPVYNGFIGDFKSFSINGMSYLESFLLKSSHISFDHVAVPIDVQPTNLPTTPPTTQPPPTCMPPFGPLGFTTFADWIGFSGTSLLAVQPPDDERNYFLEFFRINFVVTVEFRTFLPDGILFFASNNNDSALQFMYLTMQDGRLVYEFDAGAGSVKLSTDQKYDDGSWYKVYLLRISQFGAILVSETQEYHNGNNGNEYIPMHLSLPLYFGNLPGHMTQTITLRNISALKFHGCIRKFEVSDTTRTYALKLKEHALNNSINIRQCYDNVVPSVTFDSNGYALMDTHVNVTSSFGIIMTFRSTSYDGLLWSINNTRDTLYLQKSFGKVELIHYNSQQTTILISWSPPGILWRNISFALCNGTRNKIEINRLGHLFRLYFNNEMVSLSNSLFRLQLSGDLYVGGSPSINTSGFSGCIEEMVINQQTAKFANAKKMHNMRYGCPLS